MNEVETALYNVITAASMGASVYNEGPPPGTGLPYYVIEYVTSGADDAVGKNADELEYVIKYLGDSQDRMESSRVSASYANKIRTALTGPAALNTTGSMSTYTCTNLQRGAYVKYIDGSNTWHVGWTYRIRVSK